jgi:hypothetical protein
VLGPVDRHDRETVGGEGYRCRAALARCPTALRSCHIDAVTPPPEWLCRRMWSGELSAGITKMAGTPFAVTSR